MFSTSDFRNEKKREDLASHLEKWQHLQEHLSCIIQANISVRDLSGQYLVSPTKISGFCSEIAIPLDPLSLRHRDCIETAFQFFLKTDEKFFSCPHGFYYASCPVFEKDQMVGLLIVGPILIGRREPEPIYQNLCTQMEINPDVFCDRVREMKVFSHQGVRTVMEFVTELMQCLRVFI